jgi:hypothetical protein
MRAKVMEKMLIKKLRMVSLKANQLYNASRVILDLLFVSMRFICC